MHGYHLENFGNFLLKIPVSSSTDFGVSLNRSMLHWPYVFKRQSATA